MYRPFKILFFRSMQYFRRQSCTETTKSSFVEETLNVSSSNLTGEEEVVWLVKSADRADKRAFPLQWWKIRCKRIPGISTVSGSFLAVQAASEAAKPSLCAFQTFINLLYENMRAILQVSDVSSNAAYTFHSAGFPPARAQIGLKAQNFLYFKTHQRAAARCTVGSGLRIDYTPVG